MVDHSEAVRMVGDIHAGYARRVSTHWGVTVAPDDVAVGLFGYGSWSQEHRRAEIGYCLHRDYWGQGFALEALMPLIAYGFREMGLHRIHACTWVENVASVRLLEKCGFRREGVLRDEYFFEGCFHDEAHYAMLDREFESAAGKTSLCRGFSRGRPHPSPPPMGEGAFV
ncbi:hypothetical protein BH11ARM2_BH11ARM2_31510 [soil metagenome]